MNGKLRDTFYTTTYGALMIYGAIFQGAGIPESAFGVVESYVMFIADQFIIIAYSMTIAFG